MGDKKDKDLYGGSGENKPINDDTRGSAASRARNKTVMLSPEMTGEVRAMLQQKSESMESKHSEAADFGAAPVHAQPSPMDSLFSGPDRFETRSTSVLDADSLTGYETEETPVTGSGGFDPMTSLVSSAPPLSGKRFQPEIEESYPTDDRYEPEQTPAPSVEQPAASFSVAPPEAPAAARTSGSAPRRPVASGPKGWHSIVSTREKKGRLVGLLVSYDKSEEGEIFEVRSGRFLITSRPTDNGDYLLVDDESISPLHAIVRVTEEGSVQVLDQLSEFGTGLCKHGEDEEEEVAGGLATVEHGDTVRFGKRHFVVVTIPAVNVKK